MSDGGDRMRPRSSALYEGTVRHRRYAPGRHAFDYRVAQLFLDLDEVEAVLEAHPDVVVSFRLATKSGILSFLSTTTVFGTPVDVTLSELAVESFFPADAATAEALRRTGAGNAS